MGQRRCLRLVDSHTSSIVRVSDCLTRSERCASVRGEADRKSHRSGKVDLIWTGAFYVALECRVVQVCLVGSPLLLCTLGCRPAL